MQSRKITAVFVLNDFIIGGVQRLYLELFSQFDQDVYDIHLITLIDLPGKVDMYGDIPKWVHIHRLSFSKLWDLASIAALRRLLRIINPDIILSSLFFSNTVVRLAALGTPYPVIDIEQNTNTWKTFPQVFVDWLLAKRTAAFVSASQSVKEFASKQAHIAARRFTVIHNSINLSRIKREQESFTEVQKYRSEFGIAPGEKVMINVARLTHQKNQPMLIEAFAAFSKSHPDWKLLILGEGPQRAQLEELIRAHGMEGKVALAGARSDIFAFYFISDFFISTSFIEGFGIAHAEALAAGLPLVSTKTAGPDEMIIEGKNGYFTDMTVDSIAERMAKMADDGVQWGTDEIRHSVARFDSPAITKEYSRLIHDVLGRRMPGAKPRIALMTYAIDNRPAKGTAIVARKCAEELLKRRGEYDLTFVHYERADDPIYEHGVPEVIMPTFRFKLLNKRSLRQIYYFFTTNDRFDIIQWFQPRLYPFFWKAPATYRVVEVHGTGDIAKEAPFDVMRLVFNWTVKRFIHFIDAAIVSSRFAAQDIITQYGFSPEQVRIIYNGVDPAFKPATTGEIQRVREKYGLPDQFFIGVGRLNPNKNVFTCLKAYEKYCRAHPDSDIKYVNIGAKGTERKDIDTWLAGSPAKGHIQFVDYVETEDFPAVYSAALALIFPLLNEGFGLPAIEGMACGVPTLVADTAYPEIDYDEAIHVKALDIDEIAAGMEHLASDGTLRQELSRKGRERTSTLSWENMGKSLSALYQDLLTHR